MSFSNLFKKLFKPLVHIFLLALPFIVTEGVLRVYTAINVNYTPREVLPSAFLFSFGWIAVISFSAYFINKLWSRILYITTLAINFILFLTHLVYHSSSGFFFKFKLLNSVGEGSEYIWDTLKNAPMFIYISAIIVLVSGVVAIVKLLNREKTDFKSLSLVIVIFIAINISASLLLGPANKSLMANTWKNPRNVYKNFYDTNKCMQLCGLSQYTIKDFCTTIFNKKETPSNEELNFLEEVYGKKSPHESNVKSGIFEGKNVIFLQLEGIDSWLLTSEIMPNAHALMSSSINFTNHFSYYCGGGSTINSELAVITGHVTPVSFTENPYAFIDNDFKYSLPRIFKQNGDYRVNAFHMNTGEYYVREQNYKNWFFDEFYSLLDDCNYSNKSYTLDTELINNEFFYDKMFCQEGKFVNYIITYTPHVPFDFIGKSGSALANKLYGENTERPNLGEEEVARLFAAETDEMIGLLIKALKDNGLYENTVIVAYADHYLYSLHDKTILDKYKETSNNLINHTPFFIWSHDIVPETVDKVNSQLDILPTVLNMMGFEYSEETYTGCDIFDDDYSGYVFFSDYSWYDGIHYVENGQVINEIVANEKYIEDTTNLINKKILKNDLTLKYDYFRAK